MSKGKGSGTTPARAKGEYVKNTTAAAYTGGLKKGKGNFASGIQAFTGVKTGAKIVKAYAGAIAGKAKVYEKNTGKKAADDWYDGYVSAVTEK